MRLLLVLISTVILVGLFMLMIKRLYPVNPVPNSAGVDTSIPGVNRQVENLQNTTKDYNDALQKQQDLLK